MDQSLIIQLNQKAFNQLLGFVKAAEGFTIGFLEVNFKHDLDTILKGLQRQKVSQQIQWVILNLPQPDLRFLRDELVDKLTQIERIPGKKIMVLIRGLEQSIGMTGDYPPMLQDLNFVRDDYIKSVPHPLIFCLPDYAITRLAKYAPDFWAWKSGLFRFQTCESTKKQALEMTLESDRIRGSLNREESQERIDLLQRLLMESQPSGHNASDSELKNQFRLLIELGILYKKLGEVQNSKNCFQKVLSSIPNSKDFDSLKASTLHELGDLLDDQGKVDDAIALYKQSLEIKEKIGDVKGKAATLHQLAGIYANQGQLDDAIALYKQSLEIKENIGDVQGKAATLHCMAIIYANQGQVEDAIALYKQSLEITEEIGNIQGKAATLHQLAGIYANQGHLDDAIALYKLSLEIQEKIGNIQGKAITVAMIAKLKVQLGHIDEAILDFKNSIATLRKLKSPIADQVQNTLNRLLQMQN